MPDASTSQLQVREKGPEAKRTALRTEKSAVINLLSSDEEADTTMSKDKGKQPEARVLTETGPPQGIDSIGMHRFIDGILMDFFEEFFVIGVRLEVQAQPRLQGPEGSRNTDTSTSSSKTDSRPPDPQNRVVNEEVVIVEPYQPRTKGGLAEGTLTAGVSDALRHYRDRGRSFQSNTPEVSSAQSTVIPDISRAVSISSEVHSEVDLVIPSRSISVSSIRSSEDREEDSEPGVYVFELPGVEATFKLRIDDARKRPWQQLHPRVQRPEEDEDNLIFNFGKLKEVLNSTSQPSSDAKIRRPRKVQAKQLNSSNKAPGQRTFIFDAEPWLREEYGRDLQGRLLRPSTIVRSGGHAT